MIQMLRDERHVDVTAEAILFYIKMLAGKLHMSFLQLLPHQCNKAAHEVVAFVSRVGGNYVWNQVWPEWTFYILASDVNLSIRL